MLRALRIAVSVACGLCCVMVVAMWVRSYFYRDAFLGGPLAPRMIYVVSMHGRVSCALVDFRVWSRASKFPPGTDARLLKATFTDPGRSISIPAEFREPIAQSLFFDWYRNIDGVQITMPYWFVALLPVALAATLWQDWHRFSLRTLLLAMTAFALLLGLIMYAMRG